jgi:hypothetical protein
LYRCERARLHGIAAVTLKYPRLAIVFTMSEISFAEPRVE